MSIVASGGEGEAQKGGGLGAGVAMNLQVFLNLPLNANTYVIKKKYKTKSLYEIANDYCGLG